MTLSRSGTASGGDGDGSPYHGRSAEMRQYSVSTGCQAQPAKFERRKSLSGITLSNGIFPQPSLRFPYMKQDML